MSDNKVVFKGSKDGIVVWLDENSTFEELKEALEQKALSAKPLLKNANMGIIFKGFKLAEDQEAQLIDSIHNVTGLNVSFYANEDTMPKPSFTTPKFKEKPKEEEGALNQLLSEALITAKKNLTTFHKGAVRSGQSIKFPGSIVVIGDVNPGGELIAEGNIIVLGMLRGMAHAGCTGSHECFVAAINMRPTQLRIAELIACFPEDNVKNTAQYAYVNDSQIFVEPLV